MSATEELRRLLDERGVQYKRHYLNTSWYAGMKLYMATDDMDGTLTVDNLTPEQAIAATLGRPESDFTAWNSRASDRHPYEQRIVGDGSDWGEIMRSAYDDLMANACESCTPEQMRQLTDYIRGEMSYEDALILLDELGVSERTCKSTTDDNAWCFACSECGKSFPRSQLHLAHNHGKINYCPNCGAKVVGE